MDVQKDKDERTLLRVIALRQSMSRRRPRRNTREPSLISLSLSSDAQHLLVWPLSSTTPSQRTLPLLSLRVQPSADPLTSSLVSISAPALSSIQPSHLQTTLPNATMSKDLKVPVSAHDTSHQLLELTVI